MLIHMTGLGKAAVDVALRKAVARMEGGQAGQGDMGTLVGLTTVERMAQPLGVRTSDVVWSWVEEMLPMRDPVVKEGVERMAQGTGEVVTSVGIPCHAEVWVGTQEGHDASYGGHHEEAGPCPGQCVQGPVGEGTVGVGGHGQGGGSHAGDGGAGVE